MFKLQGLWKEYYSPRQDFIIVDSDEVYRIEPDNYKIDQWANVPDSPWGSWREYSYSFDMTNLRKHLTFALLYVHQVRMHHVFMDVDMKVYFIFRGQFHGPFQTFDRATFFADRLIYTGWYFSRVKTLVIGNFIIEGKQTLQIRISDNPTLIDHSLPCSLKIKFVISHSKQIKHISQDR